MADVKISGLPISTTPLDGSEVLPIVQGSITKQVSVTNLTFGKSVPVLSLLLNSNTYLYGDSANLLAQKNGVNAQIYKLYNTYTDASNYERFSIDWGVTSANTVTLTTQNAGTGLARNLTIVTPNSAGLTVQSGNYLFLGAFGAIRWVISSAGAFYPQTDNSLDLGTTSNRVRNGYFLGLLNTGIVITSGYTVATLPSTAGTGMVIGARAYVTDASTPTYGSAVVGGGAVKIPVFYNGTAWIVA